ncbi:MAG: ATP-grasp domain-containing protein [Eubacteriales bacterium]|nr:ATP-grasp domain-containing protein [Eubacteriales bacterium]
MNIGITYDTLEMYSKKELNDLHFDFAQLLSINRIKKILEEYGCSVKLIGNKDNLLNLIKRGEANFDLVYNTVEGLGSRNREGLVPAILEACHIKYMGTDAFGLSMTLDKALMKSLAIQDNIKTPKYCVICYDNDMKDINKKLRNLNYPIIIKPNFEGNSSGITVEKNFEKAINTVLHMLENYKTPVLCEEFIFGTEITVPVIGNDLQNAIWGITTVDIQQSYDFWLDVNTKLYGNYKNKLLELSSELKEQFFSIIIKLYKRIGCHDFARFDFRMTPQNEIYFIEANPLPALFEGGSFDIVGHSYGYSYNETIRKMVNTAAERLSIPKI